MHLRDYQSEAVGTAIDFALNAPVDRHGVIAMPTGTGKSLVIAGFIRRAIEIYPPSRFMMATHVKELVEQNHDKLIKHMPFAPVGIYSAGLNRKDTALPIIFGGMGSVKNDLLAFGHRDFLLIDEAQLVAPTEDTTYQNIIAGLKLQNPNLRIIGLSATPFRLKHGMLTDGNIFTDLIVDYTGVEPYNRFVQEGYLAPLIPKRTETYIDLEGVGVIGGEFNQKELNKATNKDEVTKAALAEAIEYGQDRNCWLVFASGVEHCERIAQLLNDFGIRTTFVHSKMTGKQRDENIRDFKAGYYRCMVGFKILTTGFDHPPIDMIIDLYATMSPAMHVQKNGRGGRPMYAYGPDLETIEGRLEAIYASPKHNCLVLDFARNTPRLGPINDPRIPGKKGKGGGEVPIKECESCGAYNHISATKCCSCGASFEFKVKLVTSASSHEVVRDNLPQYEYYDVTRVFYARHQKQDRETGEYVGAPMIRVTYLCGMLRFSEYVMLEHQNANARRQSRIWWQQRYPGEVPDTTEEALQKISECAVPRRIRVHVNQKFPRVDSHEF